MIVCLGAKVTMMYTTLGGIWQTYINCKCNDAPYFAKTREQQNEGLKEFVLLY